MRAQDPRSDRALVEAANGGDQRAFEALYYRHRDWIARLARRFTGSDHDALDVLQETFAYLWGKFPGFRLTAGMTTFLYPVVKHLSMDVNRRRRRHGGTEGLVEEPAAPPVAETTREELAAALRALSEAQREVVLMRYVDEMRLQEIAAALKVPLGTVKSRLHNALAALRDDPRTAEYFME